MDFSSPRKRINEDQKKAVRTFALFYVSKIQRWKSTWRSLLSRMMAEEPKQAPQFSQCLSFCAVKRIRPA